MQLQRWSGLSLIDAVWLTKDELIKDGDTFRVRTHRRKTGTPINNVIVLARQRAVAGQEWQPGVFLYEW
jgi:hypothetical protein